ncbi:hypothetical protein [Streptomyces mirabilis]|uniref:hypothetical protein n=1 Tax=Streptomyces mirabilis TaxID=68239 RepID=UPI0033BF41F4
MPSPVLPERPARAALAAHFTPAQLAAALAQFSAQEVWEESDRPHRLVEARTAQSSRRSGR